MGMMAGINRLLCDTKVSVDIKGILSLPSTLNYKVSMKCIAISNFEKFNPFNKSVPIFIYEKY